MPEVSPPPPPPTVVVTETASTSSSDSPQSTKSRKFIKFSPRLRKKSRSKENAAVKTGGASMEASGATTRDHNLQIPNGLNEKEKQELESVFEMFDKNKDGKISCEELGVVLRTLGHRYSHAEIEDMIKNADKNDNGFVEYDEFVLLMKRASAANEAAAQEREDQEGGVVGGGGAGRGVEGGREAQQQQQQQQKKKEAAGAPPAKSQQSRGGSGGACDASSEAREAFEIFDMDGNGFIDRHELRFIMSRLGENPGEEDICEMFRHADLNGDGLIDYEEFTHLMEAMAMGGPKKPAGRSPQPSAKSKSKKK